MTHKTTDKKPRRKKYLLTVKQQNWYGKFQQVKIQKKYTTQNWKFEVNNSWNKIQVLAKVKIIKSYAHNLIELFVQYNLYKKFKWLN